MNSKTKSCKNCKIWLQVCGCQCHCTWKECKESEHFKHCNHNCPHCEIDNWEREFDQKFLRIGASCLLNSADDHIGTLQALEIKKFIKNLLKTSL